MSFPKITLAVAALLVSATAANASIITVSPDDVGQSFTVDYDGFTEGQTIDGLTGQTPFTLTGVTGTTYNFDYEVANTSSDPIDDSRISIFGFNTDPNISDASATGEFDRAASGNVPSGFGQVEVCFKGSGGPNCSGGGSAGVELGDSTTGTLTLDFADALTQLTLSDFFVRYQSIDGPGMNGGSAIGRGTVSTDAVRQKAAESAGETVCASRRRATSAGSAGVGTSLSGIALFMARTSRKIMKATIRKLTAAVTN